MKISAPQASPIRFGKVTPVFQDVGSSENKMEFLTRVREMAHRQDGTVWGTRQQGSSSNSNHQLASVVLTGAHATLGNAGNSLLGMLSESDSTVKGNPGFAYSSMIRMVEAAIESCIWLTGEVDIQQEAHTEPTLKESTVFDEAIHVENQLTTLNHYFDVLGHTAGKLLKAAESDQEEGVVQQFAGLKRMLLSQWAVVLNAPPTDW